MALFGSKEKKQISKAVRSTVVRTQNVAKELQAIAKSYEVRVDTLDFNILEVQTYIRINDGTKETEWESVNNDDLYELDNETRLLNPHFQIKQTYVPGRNYRGEFLEPTEPVIAHEVTFNIDATIKEVSTEESVEYRANENAYIAFDDNTYTIKTDMDVGEISFKITGSINSGVDSDVSLNVSETDLEKDAIGTGMSVEVTEIDIDGNVGSNARVVALRATVAGQTHKTACIKADDLDINVHKGKAYGKNIKVTRLEHGEIDGDFAIEAVAG
ncbi:MAG: hypothetical protein SPLUMA2_SPLUMAMAG2_01662 [uncultured Sulfurimonas sp.]|nr:MAG: hypothetical protein SPLUMA2_SPLUMAMAG2_01662 [uncultured Sulfurimonas sp.]